MSDTTARTSTSHDLTGRRVLVPGGTGGVGEGIVRAYLQAGADVVVPTRTTERGEALRATLGTLGTSPLLHLPTHDYTTFAGAAALVAEMTTRRGGIDDVVVPVGGWWQGGPLTEIGEDDWASAFTDLTTAHMAIARATIPRLDGTGAYIVVVGQSAEFPVPGSGLVSMEQAALLMMQRVLAAESPEQRIHAMELGPVRTRFVEGEPEWVSTDEIGAAAVTISGTDLGSRTVSIGSSAEAHAFIEGAHGRAAA